MASKKTSKEGVNKSALIRKYPGIPAPEVVDKIKKEHGVSVARSLIYAIRSADKGKTGGVKVKGAKATSSTAAGLGNFDAAIRQIVREELRALLSKL
jgi:hypothetical protein